MKKFISIAAAAMMVSGETFAGGLLTNTNQNAAFLRQMSQDAIIDITGLYMNPAGTAFLSNGWHLSLNVQNAKQERNITTTFAPFMLNDGQTIHKFNGEALAPVIPSFQLSYNHDKWSVNANFAIGGGGGKCEFDKGLGSFEALTYQNIMKGIATNYAAQAGPTAIPAYMGAGMTMEQAKEKLAQDASAFAAENLTGYSMNSNMKGRNYVFGLTLGGTYKFTENLAGFVGLRLQYATNNYAGGIYDTKMSLGPALGNFTGVPATYDAADGTKQPATVDLDCDQTAFGVAPVIGIDWRANKHWNFAAKYEASTKLNLKNKTEMSDYAKVLASDPENALAQFADGAKVREDIPGLLTLGAMYSPIEKVRLMGGYHLYFDKNAKRYGNKQDKIDNNTWELTAGAEWDINKWITVSASWQRTKYGVSDDFMTDISFNVSSHALGCGLRINATDRCHIDLAYMHNFYEDRTVTVPTAAGPKTDVYERTNRVFGLGVNLDF